MKTMVIGDTGVGKTSYLLKVAANESFVGSRVVMYTTEATKYVVNLREKLNLFYNEFHNVTIVSEISSIVDVREDFLHRHEGFFNTVILDGAQYLMDICNANECLEKLAPFMNMPHTKFIFSLTNRKAVVERAEDVPGTTYLSAYCDRIISLFNKDDALHATLLKDRFNFDTEFPVSLI